MAEPNIINGVDFSEIMAAGEVASLFRVATRTVARWGDEGRLSTIRTLGGQRRFSRAEVYELLRYAATPKSRKEA